MAVRPHGQRVLVENVKSEDNIAGVIIPEAHRETRPAEAVVVEVGRNVRIDIGSGRVLSTGHRVLTNRYEGIPVRSGKRMLRMITPDDILAIVEQE